MKSVNLNVSKDQQKNSDKKSGSDSKKPKQDKK